MTNKWKNNILITKLVVLAIATIAFYAGYYTFGSVLGMLVMISLYFIINIFFKGEL